MIIFSREQAKEIIKENFELASKADLTVINVFHKDLITGEIVLTDMFSHDSVEAMIWKDNCLKSFKKLNVPYICYVGNNFEEAFGALEFTE